ncbi:hypothetical protein HDU96_002420 [Phlyctochytrium bullatum]|nr:hypothetical protein HDU96_002420 [Phlyctochytrium bullatum]
MDIDPPPSEAFWGALTTGNTAALLSLLSADLGPVHVIKDGLTGLHSACLQNRADTVKILLDHGADPMKRDATGTLPIQHSTSVGVWRSLAAKMLIPSGDLFDAAERGDDVSARLILAAETDPAAALAQSKVVDLSGWKRTVMPLHLAAFYGHAAVCRVFLEAGAIIDCRDKWEETPLMKAISKGRLEIVQLLVMNGANIEARNDDGTTPLHSAAEWGYVDIIRFLLENGAHVDVRDDGGMTPLMYAAESGRLGTFQLLTEMGADVGAKDKDGKNARDWALDHGHTAVAEFLVAAA